MNQTIRRGDYYEVDYVEPPPVIDDKKKKGLDEPNLNIYSESVLTSDAIERFRIPLKISSNDGYAISNLRQELIQAKKQMENKPDNQKLLAQINQMFLELTNLETLEKVDVNLKEFSKSQKVESKFPPPTDYTLMLPVNTDMEKRIKRLQSLQYPNLILSELMVSVLLGEKQQTFDKSLERVNENSAIIKHQELLQLSSRFEKVQKSINEFPSLVQRINKDQSIHSNAIAFVTKLRNVSSNHHEIQQELIDHMTLAKKLQNNWSQNKAVLQEAIKSLKSKIKRNEKK